MNTKMFFMDQVTAQSLEKGTDGKGDAGSIFNQRADIGRYFIEYCTHKPAVEINRLLCRMYQQIKIRNVYKRVAVSAGNP